MTAATIAAAGDFAHAALPRFRRRCEALVNAIGDLPPATAVMFSVGKDSTVLLDAYAARGSGVVIVGLHDDAFPGTVETLTHWRDRTPHLKWEVLDWRSDFHDLRTGQLRVVRERRDRALLRAALDRHAVTDVVLGLRAQESKSRRRMVSARHHGYVSAEAWGARRVHLPLAWWSDQDVWAYITTRRLPYLPVYDTVGRDARSHALPDYEVARYRAAYPEWWRRATDPEAS